MNDKQIKKALECCIGNTKCGECPIFRTSNCMNKLYGYALDLINRQQAEIDSLQSLCTSKDMIIKAQEAEIERLQKKYDRAMDNLKAVLKERAGEQNA